MRYALTDVFRRQAAIDRDLKRLVQDENVGMRNLSEDDGFAVQSPLHVLLFDGRCVDYFQRGLRSDGRSLLGYRAFHACDALTITVIYPPG